MTDFPGLLSALATSKVRFIVVGGAAATAHGAARLTQDLDIVYARDLENLERLATALAPLVPYLRGMPPGLPFTLDAAALRNGLNFTLTTTVGSIDLLGEIVGGGGFDALIDHCVDMTLFGHRCHVLDLETLIAVKRAAGRPKDIEAIAELEALLEERGTP